MVLKKLVVGCSIILGFVVLVGGILFILSHLPWYVSFSIFILACGYAIGADIYDSSSDK